jgi:hypothetical protein
MNPPAWATRNTSAEGDGAAEPVGAELGDGATGDEVAFVGTADVVGEGPAGEQAVRMSGNAAMMRRRRMAAIDLGCG